MDRGQALRAADSLARARDWGPGTGARQAAQFDLDYEEQTFVELEGGGPAAFQGLIRSGHYAPYTWEVRRFAPDEVRESRIRFTPAGAPYGFSEKIPEAFPGPALTRDSALALARTETTRWQVDLAAFDLIESAQQARPGGRVDHTFTWERRAPQLGAGRLRLRVVISGDRPTELSQFIQIPEAFTRRYAGLRTANDTIANAAFAAMLLIYGVLGLGVGLFTMLRRGLVLWRPPLVAGLLIGVLQAASFVNTLPLAWMGYDTAVPIRTHLLQQAGALLLVTLGTVLQVALTAAAAETLTRAAFPRHPQFWRLWSREAGASTALLGRTLLGLLIVGLDLAWVVWFSKATRQWRGWWNPSDLLAQPNLFATWLPWLSPVTDALQAGFWEECLFRAVPLAGAALIGDRLGQRRLWIGGALVVQALVFAAGHANYPAQPAYARVVELILPSLVFGVIYLRFGLLTGIIMHFGYDLALMALPVFVARSPGIWWSRAAVLVAGLAPLGIVIGRRVQAGRWLALPDALRNGGWKPDGRPVATPVAVPEPPPGERPEGSLPRGLFLAALTGLLVWVFAGSWSAPAPRLSVSRTRAVRLARDTLLALGVRLGPEWRALPGLRAERQLAHTLVWRTAGDSVYRSLLGTALPAPHWDVRFAKFSGDVVERAEEWTVVVQGDGQIVRISHDLPESRPGENLPEAEARRLADSAAGAVLGASPPRLSLVSIEPSRRVARTDWDVTWTDTSRRLPVGEVRAKVSLAGREVTDASRFVHVPESWKREWDRGSNVRSLAPLASIMTLVLALIGTLIAAVANWARHRFDARAAAVFTLGLVPLLWLGTLNAWPEFIADFRTTEPWALQALTAVFGGVIAQGILISAGALVVGTALPRGVLRRELRVGGALGLVLVGVQTTAEALGNAPPLTRSNVLEGLVPGGSVLTGVVEAFVVRLVLLLLVLYVGRYLSRWRWLEPVWYLLVGGAAAMLAARAGVMAIVASWLLGAVGAWMAARAGRIGGGTVLVAALAWVGLPALQQAVVWRSPVAFAATLTGMALLALVARALRGEPRGGLLTGNAVGVPSD